VRGVDPEFMDRLLSYSWPGNVRELENVMERAVVLARGERIGVDLLPKEMTERVPLPEIPAIPERLAFYDAVARYERILIENALRKTGGVQKQAAELLGLKPTTLNEKIKRLGIVVNHS